MNPAQHSTQAKADFDVLIIGAGLSGIDAAYRLKTECPGRSFAILEARERVGGTWDLFRYPGIRSDSDVETLGFPFKPWVKEKSIADGDSIRDYIEETAHEFDLYKHIMFKTRALSADWKSEEGVWSVTLSTSQRLTANFLYVCTGFYDYAEGYQPDFPGRSEFSGRFIHPQFWPDDFSPAGKKIVVIGSGATAVTLVPSLAKAAEHVTMLQRSPTFIASRPAIDPVTQKIKSILPRRAAHELVRLKNILYMTLVYQFAKKKPETVRALLKKMAKRALPETFDVETHLNPSYEPWDQRLCLAPDGDFFESIRNGRADIVTDEIERFDAGGIQLKSGARLEADVVVSATGLKLQLAGGMKLSKDSKAIGLGEHFNYKGVMISDLPNLALAIGYTNASWTLKCDLTARYVCRLLNYMDRHHFSVVTAETEGLNLKPARLLDLTSNYIRRSEAFLPKQGDQKPWKLNQNFFKDWFLFRAARIDDGTLRFR